MGAPFFYPRVPFDACKPALDRPPLFASSIAVSPPIIPPSPRGRVQLLGIAQRQIRIQFRQKQARTSKAKPLPATSKQLATGFESVGQPKISPEAMWLPKWVLHPRWFIPRRIGRPRQIKPELRGWGARPPRALLVAPSRPARWTYDSRAGTGLFRAHEVFREGAENSARGGHAPYSTSEIGLNAVQRAFHPQPRLLHDMRVKKIV